MPNTKQSQIFLEDVWQFQKSLLKRKLHYQIVWTKDGSFTFWLPQIRNKQNSLLALNVVGQHYNVKNPSTFQDEAFNCFPDIDQGSFDIWDIWNRKGKTFNNRPCGNHFHFDSFLGFFCV